LEFQATRVNSANATISATIDRETIDKHLNKIAKQLSKTADIPGFRKGKVPVAAVKKQYGQRLVEDAEAEALRELLDLGIKDLGIDNSSIITDPTFSKFDRDGDNIVVDVNVSLRPEIELGDYKSLIPEVKDIDVTDAEVDERANGLATAQAPFVEVDRAVENGDSINLDFEGFVDGVAFDGGKAENYTLKIGSGSFIPGFEEQTIGMTKGEEKDITVTFPEEYQAENLKGKEAIFKIRVNKVEIKEAVELTDELANELVKDKENATVADFKEQVKKEIENEKLTKKYNEEIKPKLMENLVSNYTFDLPASVIEKEIENRLNQKASTMTPEEVKEIQESEEKLKALQEEVRPEAEASVKATFIVDALGKAEGIEVDDQEVQNVIYYEALMGGQDPEATMKKYEEAGYLPLVKMSMLEDKVLSKLLDDKQKAE